MIKNTSKLFGFPRNRVVGFLLILIAINCFLVLLALVVFMKKKAQEMGKYATNNTRLLPSNSSTAQMAYRVRLFDMLSQDELQGFPNTVIDRLIASPDEELVGLSCDQYFVKDEETGQLFYRLDSEHHFLPDQKIINPVYQNLLANTASPKKLLAGKLCKVQDDRYILEYTLGDTDSDYMVGKNTETYLLVSRDNPQTNDPNTSPILLTRQQIWPYVGCNGPLQLTKDGTLFYSCSVNGENGDGKTLFYAVDLNSQKSTLFEKCTYEFTDHLARTCEADEQ